MRHDRLGPVGGLAAERPLIVTIVLAFGLTALAIGGATDSDAAYRTAIGMPDLLISLLVFATAPLLLGAIAPRSAGVRVLVVAAIALVFLGLFFLTAVVDPFARRLSLEAGAVIVALSAAFLFFGPAFGAVARLAFVATAAAALGLAGALGVMSLAPSPLSGAFPGLAFALGAGVGVSVLADFASLFARGADARRAAGVAARYGAAPAIYGVILVAALAAAGAVQQNDAALVLRLAAIAAAVALLPVASALLMTGGALATRRSGEVMAIEENGRQQAFRRFWRPARRTLAPSSAIAALAVLGILTIAAAFNLPAPVPFANAVFVAAASISAILMFLSLQTGIFVFVLLFTGLVLSSWAWGIVGGPALSESDVGAALAMTAALYAQLAVAWRDARSPRLNARETTEAAMADGAPAFLVAAAIALTAFWAAKVGGVWPAGESAAILLALLALYGIVVAPAAMTALSHAIGRELD